PERPAAARADGVCEVLGRVTGERAVPREFFADVGLTVALAALAALLQGHDSAVAAGDGGSHFQRYRRCPGTHPAARRRFFAQARGAGGRARSTRSLVATRPE
ncbi:MAG: hypothetical protein ACLQVI_38750, partial [Polyangiaceae bacterium]